MVVAYSLPPMIDHVFISRFSQEILDNKLGIRDKRPGNASTSHILERR
jgi:hypothetical protein